jgi:hypothetical protein
MPVLMWPMTYQSYLIVTVHFAARLTLVGLFDHGRETGEMMGTRSVWSWLAMDNLGSGYEWLFAPFEQLLFNGIYGTRTRTPIEANFISSKVMMTMGIFTTTNSRVLFSMVLSDFCRNGKHKVENH